MTGLPFNLAYETYFTTVDDTEVDFFFYVLFLFVLGRSIHTFKKTDRKFK